MKELNIASNRLGLNSSFYSDISGVVAISDAISTMGALEKLDLRNTGLGLVNRLAPARHAFMHRALGRAGDLPRNAKRP